MSSPSTDLPPENWSSLEVIAGLGQVSWTSGDGTTCQGSATPRNRSSANSERLKCSLATPPRTWGRWADDWPGQPGPGDKRPYLLPLAEGVWQPSDGQGATPEHPGAGELPVEEARGGPIAGQRHLAGGRLGKLNSPARRRRAVESAQEMFAISERRSCRALGQPRSSQRYAPQPSEAEERLTESIVSLATQYGRYGYRRITTLLQWDGWQVNHK